MLYLDKIANKKIASPKVDQFLTQLHNLCKKHKMCIVSSNTKFPVSIKAYGKSTVKDMLSNIQLELITEKNKKDESGNK